MEVVRIADKKVIGSFYGITEGADCILYKSNKSDKVQSIKSSCCIIRCDDNKRHEGEKMFYV